MAMRQLKWLLVGAGNIARLRVGAALVEARESELCAICDLDRERAESLARDLGITPRVFTDYSQALAESGCEAVYIATQVTSHVDLCIGAAKAGKHFLVEKPLTLSGEDAVGLAQAVADLPVQTSCSDYRRLSEQYRTTERLIREGAIGELTGGWMNWTFGNQVSIGNTRLERAIGGSPLKTLAFYIIDMVHNLFGPPESVFAKTCCTLNPATDTEDLSSVILSFANGAIFSLQVVFNPTVRHHELEFYGRTGSIYLENWPPRGNGPVLLRRAGGQPESIDVKTDPNYHKPMVEDFIRAVRDGREPVCSLASAVKTELITDAIFRSADSGKLELVDYQGML
ncbi:MAG: Gfo/Idh/MocA family oxidoreductase [Victivallales bacterium]|nr:Gfo/Idh/MocA family oxidoreductase [Victivallales bacterium]